MTDPLNEMSRWAPRVWPSGPPLFVTLPGLRAEEAPRAATSLYAAGFRLMLVPWAGLPTLATLQQMVRALPDDCVVGASGIQDASQLLDVANVGARLVVTPYFEPELLQFALCLRLYLVPHVYALDEALLAIQSGAQAVRLHVTSAITRRALTEFEPFVPEGVEIWPVGDCPLGVLPLRFAVEHYVYGAERPDPESRRLAALYMASWMDRGPAPDRPAR